MKEIIVILTYFSGLLVGVGVGIEHSSFGQALQWIGGLWILISIPLAPILLGD